MDKQGYLQEIYNESFNDELNKIAEDPKSYAGRGAAIGAGYGLGNLALSAKKLKPLFKANPRAAAIGSLVGTGITSGIGAGIGSLFKRKNKRR